MITTQLPSNKKRIALRYVVRDDVLKHAQDAATQRMNYDPQKRRERYLRDRDAGKTGYKGIEARQRNPWGNFASAYYDPKKAAEYYQQHKAKMAKLASAERPNRSSQQQQVPVEEAPVEEQPQEESGKSRGSGDSGGSGGSGGSGDQSERQQQIAAIREKIQQIREEGRANKETYRAEAKEQIETMKAELAERIEELKEEIQSVTETGQEERQKKQEESADEIQKEQEKASENIKKDVTKLKVDLDSKTKPIQEQNAALRGRLDSMSENNPEAQQLKKQIAYNSDKIFKANAEFTEGISKVQTQHSEKMRNNIDAISSNLQAFIQESSAKQKESVQSIRDNIKSLRESNRDEIKRVREELKSKVQDETDRVKSEVASLDEERKRL